jgi:hypothetical protein
MYLETEDCEVVSPYIRENTVYMKCNVQVQYMSQGLCFYTSFTFVTINLTFIDTFTIDASF